MIKWIKNKLQKRRYHQLLGKIGKRGAEAGEALGIATRTIAASFQKDFITPEFLELFKPVKNPNWRWWKFWEPKFYSAGTVLGDDGRPVSKFDDDHETIDIVRGNQTF